MANRFPLVINNNSTLVGELIQGDAINLSLSGIFDGSSNGSLGQVLSSTGGAGVLWIRAADVFVDDSQTLLNKSFTSSTFDGAANTFQNIPNSGLVNPSIIVNGNSVSLGGSVNTPNDNDNTTYGLSMQDGFSAEQFAVRLTAGGTGTGFQDNFIQYDTDPDNHLIISRIGTDTLQFSVILEDLTLSTHLSFLPNTAPFSYNGINARQIVTDATPTNTAGTIVSRDAFGNFNANLITSNLTGNVTGNVTGSAGSVEQSLTLGTFLNFDSGTTYNGGFAREIQIDATSSNNSNTIVSRDGSGNFSANQITANLTGDVTGNSDTASQVNVREADAVITATELVLSSSTDGNQNVYHTDALTFDNTNGSKVLTVGGTVIADDFLFSSGGPVVPTGVIQMWGGGVGTVPNGYQVCNGSAPVTTALQAIVGSTVPDLRDRFIVGAGANYTSGSTGGSTDSVVVSHNHGTTQSQHSHGITDPQHAHGITDPGHTHQYGDIYPLFGENRFGDESAQLFQSNTERTPRTGNSGSLISINNNNTGISVNNNSITISVDNEGVSGSNRNLPPYYALIYIIKT